MSEFEPIAFGLLKEILLFIFSKKEKCYIIILLKQLKDIKNK